MNAKLEALKNSSSLLPVLTFTAKGLKIQITYFRDTDSFTVRTKTECGSETILVSGATMDETAAAVLGVKPDLDTLESIAQAKADNQAGRSLYTVPELHTYADAAGLDWNAIMDRAAIILFF